MAEQINNNSNEPGFLKALIVYCYNKMIKNEIFRYEEINQEIIISKKTASEMDQDEKDLILLSLEEISSYSKDFEYLRAEFAFKTSQSINLKNFQKFIINEKKGFYYKMAFLSFIFRCLLLIFQILILFLIKYPKNLCIENEIEETDNKFWFYEDKKCKVKVIKHDIYLYLEIMNYILDAFFLVCELLFLLKLERKTMKKYLIICCQLVKYLISENMIVLDYYTGNYCDNSKYNKNLFFIKNNVLEIISIIYEFLKFFIS